MATDVISNGPGPVPNEDANSRLQEAEPTPDVSTIADEVPKANGKESASSKSAEGTSSTAQSNRSKKKEDKSIEHILKALSSLEKPEEKLAALCKKYADLLEEHRVLQTWSKQNQKKLTMVMREKDQLQTEHSKAVLAKSKLESLCRELQRHNKLVKEESLSRAREEEDKRKEVTTKFQSTISEIQQQMTENSATNIKLREEKAELVGKIKTLIEKYELREQHFDKVLKHKEIEQQLAEAKLAQSELVGSETKEIYEREKQALMMEAANAQQKIMVLMEQEKQLRSQVALYTDKYEEFQDTLKKSNDVFSSFKSETEQMTKKIKKLEKETNMWRTRWENSNKALLQMVEDKTKNDSLIASLNGKVKKLESLCRALQHRNANKDSEENGSRDSPVNGAEASTAIMSNEVTSQTSSEGNKSELPTSGGGGGAPGAEPSSVSSSIVSSTSTEKAGDPTTLTQSMEALSVTAASSEATCTEPGSQSSSQPGAAVQQSSSGTSEAEGVVTSASRVVDGAPSQHVATSSVSEQPESTSGSNEASTTS